MFLKSLTLNGFKAFAEKTIFTFDIGICALIGPNGCGKSNVIDAIKWVVGEQKISMLRGEKMEDIIFHGSEGSKICNMAEVEMIVVNQNSILPIEMSEISIKRRLYRSGEMEFFINQKLCRLKDVQNLFLETGIGRTASSVIEQGQIDKIFSKHPEERRHIFEEASSILKYKEKRKEYERKIKNTQENLTRINDILFSYQDQLENLKKQVKSSKHYKELQGQYHNLAIDLIVCSLFKKKEKQKKNIELFKKTEVDLKDKKEKINTFKKSLDEIKDAIRSQEGEIFNYDREKIKREGLILSNQQANLELGKRIQEMHYFLSQYEKKINATTENQKLLKQKIKEIEILLENNKKATSEVKEKLTDINFQKENLFKKIEYYQENKNIASNRIKEIAITQKKETIRYKDAIDLLLKEIDDIQSKITLQKQSNDESLEKLQVYGVRIKNTIDSIFSFLQVESSQISNFIQLDDQSYEKKIKINLDKLPDSILRNHYLELLQKGRILYKNWNEYQILNFKLEKERTIFQDLFFSTEGAYVQKKQIEENIDLLLEEKSTCEQEIEKNEINIHRCNDLIKDLSDKITQEEKLLSALSEKNTSFEQEIKEKNKIIVEHEKTIKENQIDFDGVQLKINELTKEKKEKEKQITSIEKEIKSINKSREKSYSSIEKQTELIKKNTIKAGHLESELEQLTNKHNQFLTQFELLKQDINNVRKSTLVEHGIDPEEIITKSRASDTLNLSIDENKIRTKIDEIKREMNRLSQTVNLLADQEYEKLSLKVQEMTVQKKDVENSILDLEEVVKEIEKRSEDTFLNTFHQIRGNFSHVFKRLFDGGDAKIELLDERNPLISGIEIFIQPPGKKMQNVNLLSGGEKSLIAISLMFSIFLVKPAPLCLLDEVDSALDKSNINRFANILNDFKSKTQFILISHNEKTVSIIDYVYGITMNNGVTKAVSMKIPYSSSTTL